MEILTIEEDITVFYIKATSFPQGITHAFDRLNNILPSGSGRRIFGLSRPEDGGEIVYRAAAEVNSPDEGKMVNCNTMIIPKGKYISIPLENFTENPESISQAFGTLLKHPDLDPLGYCVEAYDPELKSMRCMIRLEK